MRLAIITGGSRGLGAALCDLYRERGWKVVEFSRSAPHPFSIQLDLADVDEATEVLSREFDSLATLDVSEVVAVGNASLLGPVGPVERSSPADIVAHLNANVASAILFARGFAGTFGHHAVPKTFVNISSGAASRGLAGWSLYCASKAALENYVRAVALEQQGRPHPIRAFSVNPGVMDTVMQEEVRTSRPDDFPDVERYARLHRDGRLAQPAEIAARIVELVDSRPRPGDAYSVQ